MSEKVLNTIILFKGQRSTSQGECLSLQNTTLYFYFSKDVYERISKEVYLNIV